MGHDETPRNPLCSFAATIDDIEPGLELMSYSTQIGLRFVTPGGYPVEMPTGIVVVARSINDSSTVIKLADIGVVENYTGLWHGWNTTHFCVVSTPPNRKKFVDWLIRQDQLIAREAATRVMNEYPGEFVRTTFEVCGSGINMVTTLVF